MKKLVHELLKIGASITPDEIANAFNDKERFDNLWDLSMIGASVDVDGLIKNLKPRLDTHHLALYLKEGAKLETINEMFAAVKFKIADSCDFYEILGSSYANPENKSNNRQDEFIMFDYINYHSVIMLKITPNHNK